MKRSFCLLATGTVTPLAALADRMDFSSPLSSNVNKVNVKKEKAQRALDNARAKCRPELDAAEARAVAAEGRAATAEAQLAAAAAERDQVKAQAQALEAVVEDAQRRALEAEQRSSQLQAADEQRRQQQQQQRDCEQQQQQSTQAAVAKVRAELRRKHTAELQQAREHSSLENSHRVCSLRNQLDEAVGQRAEAVAMLAALEVQLRAKEQARVSLQKDLWVQKGIVAKLQKREGREAAAQGRTAEPREDSTTTRSELESLQRSLAEERKQRANALAESEELRRAVKELEARVPLGRGQQREAAPVTAQSKAEQRAKAVAAAEAAGLVVVHPLKDGDRCTVRTLEAVRRLSSVCHVPGKHVASAIDHVFTLLTHKPPADEYQTYERIDATAHRTLGIEDERRQQDSSSEKYMVASHELGSKACNSFFNPGAECR